jgi:hypothetical protein
VVSALNAQITTETFGVLIGGERDVDEHVAGAANSFGLRSRSVSYDAQS